MLHLSCRLSTNLLGSRLRRPVLSLACTGLGAGEINAGAGRIPSPRAEQRDRAERQTHVAGRAVGELPWTWSGGNQGKRRRMKRRGEADGRGSLASNSPWRLPNTPSGPTLPHFAPLTPLHFARFSSSFSSSSSFLGRLSPFLIAATHLAAATLAILSGVPPPFGLA